MPPDWEEPRPAAAAAAEAAPSSAPSWAPAPKLTCWVSVAVGEGGGLRCSSASLVSMRWCVTLMICVSAALAVVLLIRFLLIRWMWKQARTESSKLASCTSQCAVVIIINNTFITCRKRRGTR